MTVPKPPADLLRRTADLVEQRAAAATPGPWELEMSYGGDRVQALFVGCCDGEPDEPPCSPDCFDGTRGIGGFDDSDDNRWAALMHPGVAATLAAWLRAEADRAEQAAKAWTDHDAPIPKVAAPWDAAVAFARALIGEDQP